MKEMRWLWQLYLTCAIIISGGQSNEVCPELDEESILQNGLEYSYSLQAQVNSKMSGSENSRSEITLDGKITITHSHSCFYKLQMLNFSFASGDNLEKSEAFYGHQNLASLSRYPVMFSMSNGIIKHIYPDPYDFTFAVNMKKAVLSILMFKLSMTTKETKEVREDIHGSCYLISSPQSGGIWKRVKTYKKLSQCTLRQQGNLSNLWSLLINEGFITSSLDFSSECEYGINLLEQRMEEIKCEEKHSAEIKSFQGSSELAETIIHYKMEHLQTAKLREDTKYELPPRKTGISFEYGNILNADNNLDFLPAARRLLKGLVETELAENEIKPSSIRLFKTLVEWLRMSADVMPFVESVLKCADFSDEIFSSYKNLSVSYLTDALIECNSVSCTEAISHLAMKNFLPDAYLDFFLHSWSSMMDHLNTEAAYYFMNICQRKKSNACWLTLGTLVKKYMMMQPSRFEALDSLKKIASYYGDQIRSVCLACSSSAFFSSVKEQHSHLHTFVKGIGNMGEHYITLVPNGLMPLLSCLNSSGLSVYQKTAILETLKKFRFCNNSELCKVIRLKLLPMLAEENDQAGLRIHVFKLLMDCPEQFNLLSVIIKILKEHQNSEINVFIASDLKSRMQDQNYTKEHKQFIQELLHELQGHKIQLHDLHNGKENKSSSFIHGYNFKYPYLPQESDEFRLYTVFIYRFYNMLPRFLQSNITVHLLSNIAHIVQSWFQFEGFEDISKIVLKIYHEISTKPLDLGKLCSALLEVLSFLNSGNSDYEAKYLSDDVIINSLKMIYLSYKTFFLNSEASSFLREYLDMFGSALNFISVNDIMKFVSNVDGSQEISNHQHEGINFNSSRIMRLMETHYQVPTILGLPLSWKNDLTLAFSLRSDLKSGWSGATKLDWNKDISFQPSATLTFLNKMMLGYPKMSLVGLQVNSSYYTSTLWKARQTYNGSNKTWMINIQKPVKPQTLLQFFYQKELIKPSGSEDIADCEKPFESCTGDGISSIFGIKLCWNKVKQSCFSKSCSDCCKWGISIYPDDRNIKIYTFEISAENGFDRNVTELRFHTPGATHSRDVIVSFARDRSNMGNSLNLTIPELPDFSVSASSKELAGKGGTSAYEVQASLQLSEDFKYHFTYKNCTGCEGSNEGHENSVKSGKKTAFVWANNSTIQLVTPFNLYKLTKKTIINGAASQQRITASYSNFVSEWNWLSRILPSNFWETNHKAWFEVDFDLRETELQKGEIKFYSTSGYLKSPHILNKFILSSSTEPKRKLTHFSLSKINTESVELDTFLNFTLDLWSSEGESSSEKELRIFNLTIPLMSWSTEIQNTVSEGKLSYDITVTQAAMTYKDVGYNYVGWWNNGIADKFDLQEQTYKFKVDLSDEILQEVSPVSDNLGCGSDNPNVDPLYSKVTNFAFEFYLQNESQEKVKCYGKYIVSAQQDLFRFQVDFSALISQMNLKLDSSSVYQNHKGVSKVYHKDTFTCEKTGTEAVYNLFAQHSQVGECRNIDFSHNIASNILDFSSNVSYHCKASDPKLHILLLNIDSSSLNWNVLNSELRQILEDVNHEYSEESMNYSTPLMIINVTADWIGAQRDHKKQAVFTSLWNEVPSFVINYESMAGDHRSFHIDFDDEMEVKIICKMQYLNELMDFQVQINYTDKENNKEWIPVISLKSKLESTGEKIWEGEINRSSLQKLNLFWDKAFLKAQEILSSIASEPGHPLNKILKPMLNATLFEYYISLESQVKQIFNLILLKIGKIATTLEPLYNPVISIISNLASEVKTFASYMNLLVNENFETTWNDHSLQDYFISKLHYVLTKFPNFVNCTHINQHTTTFKFRSSLFHLFKLNVA